MKCTQVQRLYDDLTAGRLPEPQSRAVRQHLTDCTDCRVQHQRTAKLQRVLALKRYERPSPAYFDSFLPRLHARLAKEAARGSLWQRFLAATDLEPLVSWRYGLATVAGLLGALGLLWVGLLEPASQPTTVAIAGEPLLATVTPDQPTEEQVTLRFGLPLPADAALDPTMGSGRPVLASHFIQPSPTPRYVLDHITPAAYEVSRVDF